MLLKFNLSTRRAHTHKFFILNLHRTFKALLNDHYLIFHQKVAEPKRLTHSLRVAVPSPTSLPFHLRGRVRLHVGYLAPYNSFCRTFSFYGLSSSVLTCSVSGPSFQREVRYEMRLKMRITTWTKLLVDSVRHLVSGDGWKKYSRKTV